MVLKRTHLVLLPALGCNGGLYTEFASQLPQVDDTTIHSPTANRYETMVEELLADASPEFVILGTSMGARLALETTLAAPRRVKGLVMIGSAAGPVADQAAGLRRSQRIRNGEFETVIEEMAAIISHLPGSKGPATRDAFIRMAHETGPAITANHSDALAYRTDRWQDIASITCPTLFLWGRQDQFSLWKDAERMHGLVPRSTLEVIEDCGHFPTLEYPEQSAAAIAAWLRDSDLV